MMLVPWVAALFFSTPTVRTIQMDSWDPPLAWCGIPTIMAGRLLIEDKDSKRVHVFDVRGGVENPVFLWKTPPRGKGPGEIPEGANINNLSIAPDGSLWVSHKEGLSVYDHDGKHLWNKPGGNNKAWVIPTTNGAVLTSPNPLRFRVLLKRTDKDLEADQWKIESPQGLPTTANGSFVMERPELYRVSQGYAVYDPTTGELAVVDDKGEFVLQQRIPQRRAEMATLVSFTTDFVYGKGRMSLLRHVNPHVGLVEKGGFYYTQAINRCHGVETGKGSIRMRVDPESSLEPFARLLVKVKADTGERVGRYYHAASELPSYLFHIGGDGRFYFFDQEAGDMVYVVAESDLVVVDGLEF